MIFTSNQSQVCLDAYSSCQLLLKTIAPENGLNGRIIGLLNECAHLCVGTFYAIENASVNAPQMALLCMGICEECAEACESFDNTNFKICAAACRYCSSTMQDLAMISLD